MRLALTLVILGLCTMSCGGSSARQRTIAADRADDRHDRRVEAMTGWEKLGERWVDGRVDRDSIHVGRDIRGDVRFDFQVPRAAGDFEPDDGGGQRRL